MMTTIVLPAESAEQAPVGRLAASFTRPIPVPFFTDQGIPQRVLPPSHVDSHLPGVISDGRYGLRLDTVQMFDVPEIRQFRKPTPEIPAWMFVADTFPALKLDKDAAIELTRWLVWHGFIEEALLADHDLPELSKHSGPVQSTMLQPANVLFTPELWEAFVTTKNLDVPVGYLGELNTWRAEMTREGYDLVLVLETCVGVYRLPVNTYKGDRGRYAYLTSAGILAAFHEASGLPPRILSWIRSLVYFADKDGRVGLHRFLCALWFEANMNPQGKHQGRPDDLDAHHLNHQSLDNRLVNLLPVLVAQHSAIHGTSWKAR